MVASLGVRLGVIQILWLGYGVLGGMGLGIGYITPVSTLEKWFPDRRGMPTGLAIMGFGFGAAIGGPAYNYIMSDVAAKKLEISGVVYRAGIANYNSAKSILKAIHVNNDSGYSIEQLLTAVRAGNNEEILGRLPPKLAQDARSSLVELKAALISKDLAPSGK